MINRCKKVVLKIIVKNVPIGEKIEMTKYVSLHRLFFVMNVKIERLVYYLLPTNKFTTLVLHKYTPSKK